MEIKSFEDDVNSRSLSSISITCSKHVLPYISCPWRCSELFHIKEKITFDIIIQRYLPKYSLKLLTISNLEKTGSARDDY